MSSYHYVNGAELALPDQARLIGQKIVLYAVKDVKSGGWAGGWKYYSGFTLSRSDAHLGTSQRAAKAFITKYRTNLSWEYNRIIAVMSNPNWEADLYTSRMNPHSDPTYVRKWVDDEISKMKNFVSDWEARVNSGHPTQCFEIETFSF